jgi:polysaccharide export outer membrane protein
MNFRPGFSLLVVLTLVLSLTPLGCAWHWPPWAPVDHEQILPKRIPMSEATLGEGDRIAITVYRHSDLDSQMTLTASGVVFIPLAGELNLHGVGVTTARRMITEALDPYLVDPQVSMNVTMRRSQKVTVLGEVRTPGLFTLDGPITVIEAIGLAHGFTQAANRRQVILIRMEKGQPVKYVLDIKWATMEAGLEHNPQLKKGDILYVPPSVVAHVDRFSMHVLRWLQPIISLEQAILLGYDAKDQISGEEFTSNVDSTVNFNVN